MNKLTKAVIVVAVALALAACNEDTADVTTTTIDASLLTTTTSLMTDTQPDADDPENGTTDTTVAVGQTIESYETISRQSTDEGETLFILVEPGEYTDVSFEGFLVRLLEDEPALIGAEVFDDRVALDAALKDEGDRTAEELQALADHHLVSLVSGREVRFQGPMTEYDDFVIGS
ncbi:hypothetical protein BH23ACT5_BH23ACT5_20510 [soil metagenome]